MDGNGTLILTANPGNGTAGQFQVSGDSNLADNAKFGLNFVSKLTAPTTFDR